MNHEITVIGFPKCGTSALMRNFEDDLEMRILRAPGGAMEVAWPFIRDIRPEPESSRILAHKFTAYVYNKNALEYLVGVNPRSLLVLCVRNPVRALVSWHNMHRSIARSGTAPEHFAWKERAFYAECSLSDYYEKFAQTRLQYDKYLREALSIVPKNRLVVVSQERIAEDLNAVAGYLKALARSDSAVAPEPLSDATQKHEGYADRADIMLDAAIRQELAGVQQRLADVVANDVSHKFT